MRRDDDWNHYHYVYGENREATVRFDVGCALMPTPSSHGTCVRVLVRGEPDDLEQRLAEILVGVDCWMVGVATYAGTTAYVLQVEDVPAFDRRQQALVNAIAATVELERSEGWGFFDERVCPNEVDWQRISDREQCERLGLEPNQDRPVVHGFYGSTASLARIQERLLAEGLTLHSGSADRLEMIRIHPLCSVSEVSVPLARFARTVGAAYDGWRPVG